MEAALDEESKYELELVRAVAAAHPNHAASPAQLLEYHRKVAEARAKAAAEGRSLDDDEAYGRLVASKPLPPRVLIRKTEADLVRTQAVQEAKREFSAELEKRDLELIRIRETPRVEQTVREFGDESLKQIAEIRDETIKELVDQLSKGGASAVVEADPVHGEILINAVEAGRKLVATIAGITRGVTKFDPTNAAHMDAVNFVRQQEALLAKADEAIRVDDRGRTWLSRADYHAALQKDPAAATRHWCLEEADLVQIAAIQTKVTVEKGITQTRARLEKAGFAPKPKAPKAPVTATPPPPVTPPVIQPQPAAGAGNPPPPKPVKRLKDFGDDAIKVETPM